MKKRFPALALLLTLLLCVTVRAAEPRLEVHLPAEPVEAGQEFAVTVDLTGNPGVLTVQFTLAFDRARMECVSAKAGELLAEQADASVVNPNAASGAKLASASADAITGDGQVGIFRFRAKEKLSDFHFSIEDININDRNRNALDVAVTDAEASASGNAADSGASSSGSNGAAASNNGSASGGNGSSSNGGKATDSGSASGGGKATDSGNKAADNGSTSGESKAADNGSTSSGSKPADNGSTSGESEATDSGRNAADNGNATDTGSASAPTSAAPLFTDIAGTWAEDYITAAAERNLFQGYADGTFRPDNRLTRAQFMMVLWNLAGRPAPSAQSPFKDMGTQIENFQKAVAWAYEKGYVNGTSAETFSPGEPLTRQAAVKILFAYNGSRRGAEALLTAVYDGQYSDSGLISSWAKSAMYWAVYQGVLSGTSPTTLNPGGAVTRAQLAAIMVRYTDRFPAP